MRYMVDVGLICNRLVYTVVFGINSTYNAVRKCEIHGILIYSLDIQNFLKYYYTTIHKSL